MKILDIIKTANSNLSRSRLRTFLTILAIFVGSLTLTLTTAVGAGVRDYVDKQTNAVSTPNTFFVLPSAFSSAGFTTAAKEYDPEKQSTVSNIFVTKSDIDAIKQVKNIQDAELSLLPKPEYITRNGQKKYLDNNIDTFIKNLVVPLSAGKLPDYTKTDEMLLAYTYLEPLGFAKPEDAVGQKVTYVFKTAKDLEWSVDVTIVGVLINTLTGSQNRITSALAEEVYRFQYGATDSAQSAIAFLKPGLSAEEKEAVKNDLKAKGYNTTTFEDQIKSIKDFLGILQTSVNLFGIIVIVAASIGIINTLLMAVYERTREIGLMKALGMRSGGIFSMFAIEAASIGFWGGLIGILIAMGIGSLFNNYAAESFLKGFEGFTLFIFPWYSLLPILIGTMLVGLIAGTLPAIKAARLNPIEALKYE